MTHDESDPIEAPDMACLRQFVHDRSQEAFAELVRRRIDMVYSAAVRQVCDVAMAEDVTQTVFITLAQKAGELVHRDVVLSAWLYRATHLAALAALRRERRRRKHEQQAAKMHAEQATTRLDESTWDDVRPLLDAAMMDLSEKDRRAIALRYFEGRSVREIGSLQGISEDAARQRLWRATERLRTKLTLRGVTPSVVGLAGVLGSKAVQAAPATLADATTHAALSAAAAKAAIPLGLKGAIQLMVWTKAQMTGAVIVAALLVGGTTATVIYVNRPPSERRIVLAPGTAPTAIAAQPAELPGVLPMSADTKESFNRAYSLEPGQVVKHLPPPFIPERAAYLKSIDNQHMFDVKTTRDLYAFSWDGREAGFRQWTSQTPTVGLLIHDLLGVPTYKLEMLPVDYNRRVPGDWVFRQGATLEQQFAGLSRSLADELQLHIRFEQREAVRPVLIATGQLVYKPLNPADGSMDTMNTPLVHFYLGKPPRKINGMAIGDRNALFRAIGESLGREVIYDSANGSGPATRSNASYVWSNHLSGKLSEEQIAQAAKNIGEQLGLNFTPDRRNVSYWSETTMTDSASSR